MKHRLLSDCWHDGSSKEICTIPNARTVGCRSVTLLAYILIQLQHWKTTHTHTHTHTQTHIHTHLPTAQENAQKHLQTCTASRHYHLYTKFADSCGYPRLRGCSYERARVRSERAICEDDFKAKSYALRLFHATDTCQTLAYVIHGAHPLLRRSCHFSVAAM